MRSILARHGALILVVAVLTCTAAVRLRLADVPLERDEGEYAYAGQLVLEGIPPYKLAYNMKFPGTYYGYAVLMACFGETPRGIHTGLMVLNTVSALAVFFLGRRFFGDVGAATAASMFAVISIDRWVGGIFAHATHFVLVPALLGWLVLLRTMESRRVASAFGAGVLFGLAVLMKQHAVFYAVFAVGALLVSDWQAKPKLAARASLARIAALVAGLVLPFAVVCAVLSWQGVFDKFWFWTFAYAKAYVSETPLSEFWWDLNIGWTHVDRVSLPIWAVAAAGIPALWIVRWPHRTRWMMAAWLVLSFVAICPGQYFRPHYFVLLLPSVGLCCGALVAALDRIGRRWCPIWVARAIAIVPCVLAAGVYVQREQAFLLTDQPRQVSRRVYSKFPFPEAVDIADYIRTRSAPTDRVAVVGSEPEIYFYAHRHSATGYIYTYALMEDQPFAKTMQREMIAEIEAVRPSFLVYAPTTWSSGVGPQSDRAIFKWADQYARQCYDLVGLTDLYSYTQTATVWDADVAAYKPRSEDLIYVYRRKPGGACVALP